MHLKERAIKYLGALALIVLIYNLGACSTLQPTVSVDIKQGYFKTNIERLAIEYNLTPVVWEDRITKCDWRQKTSYQITATNPEQAIARYASGLDFNVKVSRVDRHMKLVYIGPKERLSSCM